MKDSDKACVNEFETDGISARLSKYINVRTKPRRRVAPWFFLFLSLLFMEVGAVHADEPSGEHPLAGRPVTLIVPFSPGGGTDLLARTLAPVLSKELGTSVLVDNKPGASGAIAAQYTARSVPDGHTLMVGSISEIGINPSIYPNLPYNVKRDFVPVVPLASSPMVLIVNPGSPIKTPADLVRMAREHPGELTFGSAGVGSGSDMAAELFLYDMKIKMTHIPYKGVSQVTTDLIGSQKDMTLFTTQASIMGVARSGQLRVVAVSSKERSPLMPDTPTFLESGIPYVMDYWWGLIAPKGTPENILQALHSATTKVLHDPRVVATLANQSLLPKLGSQQEFAAFIDEDMKRWATIVKATNMTMAAPAE